VGVLLQIGRGFIDEVIPVAHDFLRGAGAGRGTIAAVRIVHGASCQDEGHQTQGDQADRGGHLGDPSLDLESGLGASGLWRMNQIW